ncbi:GNAT family N-acetyltransferase [Aliamphritea hakodatensis]|uniref:GNAT family N-acetyltransferase n=1 Tax=Aliamphritea hakodatensis TaxID=2895352 RepID=UPI0022FD3DDE|nr:GNAT family N-acetyltransferase [Aliamphritea hakodatensis]
MQTSPAFSLNPLENTAEQRLSAARLICTNMGDYYRKYSMAWNQQIFDQNWPHRQNFSICHGTTPIGLLSLSLYNRHAYIRELQIMPGWQGRGAGSWALQVTEELARQHNCECLRLKVFICNPALKLYDRAGFLIKMRDGNIFGMEKNITAIPSQTPGRYSLR